MVESSNLLRNYPWLEARKGCDGGPDSYALRPHRYGGQNGEGIENRDPFVPLEDVVPQEEPVPPGLLSFVGKVCHCSWKRRLAEVGHVETISEAVSMKFAHGVNLRLEGLMELARSAYSETQAYPQATQWINHRMDANGLPIEELASSGKETDE